MKLLAGLPTLLLVSALSDSAPPPGDSDTARASRTAQARAPRRLPPRDQTERDPTFKSFRSKLEAAALRGDRATLTSLIAADVKTIEDAITPSALLDGHDVRSGRPWASLLDAMSWGAAYNSADESFTVPYFAEADIDVGEWIALGQRVRLRDAPVDGEVIRWLSFEVVGVRNPAVLQGVADSEQWAQVKTDLGELGYVARRFLGSPSGARFTFQKLKGEWKLVAYGRGD